MPGNESKSGRMKGSTDSADAAIAAAFANGGDTRRRREPSIFDRQFTELRAWVTW